MCKYIFLDLYAYLYSTGQNSVFHQASAAYMKYYSLYIGAVTGRALYSCGDHSADKQPACLSWATRASFCVWEAPKQATRRRSSGGRRPSRSRICIHNNEDTHDKSSLPIAEFVYEQTYGYVRLCLCECSNQFLKIYLQCRYKSLWSVHDDL